MHFLPHFSIIHLIQEPGTSSNHCLGFHYDSLQLSEAILSALPDLKDNFINVTIYNSIVKIQRVTPFTTVCSKS